MCDLMAGIYMILNLVTNMYYIGHAVNFNKRWKEHIRKLNNDNHSNRHLQNAWNLYGEVAFKFYVLEYIADRNILGDREQYWMDQCKCYERNIGYNIRKVAESNLGLKTSKETRKKLSIAFIGRKFTDEARAKMSESGKLKVFTKSHKASLSAARIGKKHSLETKAKMVISITNKWAIKKNELGSTIR